jgi:hypothetical protein
MIIDKLIIIANSLDKKGLYKEAEEIDEVAKELSDNEGEEVQQSTPMNASEKTIELGGTVSGGINWTWSIGFSPEAAEEFEAWLDDNGYDHRGIYPNRDSEELRDVRWR